jgi:hypothetical protein
MVSRHAVHAQASDLSSTVHFLSISPAYLVLLVKRTAAHRATKAVEMMARRVEAVDHAFQPVNHGLRSIQLRLQPIQAGLNTRHGLVSIRRRVRPIKRGFIGVSRGSRPSGAPPRLLFTDSRDATFSCSAKSVITHQADMLALIRNDLAGTLM